MVPGPNWARLLRILHGDGTPTPNQAIEEVIIGPACIEL